MQAHQVQFLIDQQLPTGAELVADALVIGQSSLQKLSSRIQVGKRGRGGGVWPGAPQGGGEGGVPEFAGSRSTRRWFA